MACFLLRCWRIYYIIAMVIDYDVKFEASPGLQASTGTTGLTQRHSRIQVNDMLIHSNVATLSTIAVASHYVDLQPHPTPSTSTSPSRIPRVQSVFPRSHQQAATPMKKVIKKPSKIAPPRAPKDTRQASSPRCAMEEVACERPTS